MKRTTMLILLVAGLAMMSGCEEDDERLAEMAQDATRRQAEQNKEMVRLNREVSVAHQRVIEADAQSRQEVIQVQRELIERDAEGREQLDVLQRDSQTAIHQERSSLDSQHKELESDRKEIATQRNRDPIVAAAITGFGVILACLAPIGLAITASPLPVGDGFGFASERAAVTVSDSAGMIGKRSGYSI